MNRILLAATLAVLSCPVLQAQDEPEKLAELRESYESYAARKLEPIERRFQQQVQAYEAKKAQALAPLQRQYLQQLEKLQEQYTRAGELENAIAVKAVIEELEPATQLKSGFQRAAAMPARDKNSVAGKWNWSGSWGEVTVNEDGTFSRGNDRMGEWNFKKGSGKYIFNWDQGYKDTLELSADGNTLKGTGTDGEEMTVERAKE